MRIKFIIAFLCLGNCLQAQFPSSHRVLSCNVRVALPQDEAKGYGWVQRKQGCLELIRRQNPDIVCFQEVLRTVNEDIKTYFGKKYVVLGYDGPEMDVRTDGYHNIAKNVLMFSKMRYDLLAAGTYWLSDNPLIGGSMSWETSRARHVNWVRLKDKKSGVVFRVMDVHLDHISQEARLKQVDLIIKESGQYLSCFPQLLVGDMNSAQDHPEAELLRQAGWKDTYQEVNGPYEIGTTNHEFFDKNSADKVRPYRIDFIYAKGDISSTKSFLIKDKIGKIFPSDHYFLAADLNIR
jgi:endonuclease/exonuclease/phosphatase family metal-dependent hydrolase